VRILARTLDQKCRILAKEKFLQNQTLNIQMTISHLSEQVDSWNFDMIYWDYVQKPVWKWIIIDTRLLPVLGRIRSNWFQYVLKLFGPRTKQGAIRFILWWNLSNLAWKVFLKFQIFKFPIKNMGCIKSVQNTQGATFQT
jgi:hypothetical protein